MTEKTTNDPTASIEKLVKSAVDAAKSEDALRFSQAALNTANAFAVATNSKRPAA